MFSKIREKCLSMNIRSLLDKASHSLAAITNLNNNRTDENGNAFSLDSFHTDTSDLSQSQSVTRTLSVTENDTALLFRSRNVFVDIYVNDVLVSQDDRDLNVIFGTSSGSR